jgi:hypothetical protein
MQIKLKNDDDILTLSDEEMDTYNFISLVTVNESDTTEIEVDINALESAISAFKHNKDLYYKDEEHLHKMER